MRGSSAGRLLFIMPVLILISAAAVMVIGDSDDSDASSTFTVGGVKYTTTSDSTVEVVSNSYSGSVTIPSIVKYSDSEYSVTSIGIEAFSNCGYLTSVTIGNNVESIGSSAFYGCSHLTRIDFNAINCGDLYYYSNVFSDAGSSGTGITVVFGDEVTRIPSYLFYANNSNNSAKITSISIGDNVKSIGGSAFYECTPLTFVTFGNNVTSIGNSAFYGCTNLTRIDFNAINCGDLSYYSNVFSDAGSSGTGITVVFGDEVIGIPSYLFYSSSSKTAKIASVSIGDNVKSIGGYAFYECASLTSVIIGNNVTSIGGYAFCECTSLTSLTIPNNVKVIGSYAFSGCTCLTRIDFNAIDCNDLSYDNNVFYNAGSSGTGITVVFGDEVTRIPLYLFYSSSSKTAKIASVSIGDNVKSIGSYTFYRCISLTSVVIGQSVISIGDNAFCECTSLTSMPLPDRVTSIGSSAFSGCTSLTSVTIGNSVTSIGSSAFSGCTCLTRIDFNAIGCSDLSYDNNVFYNAGSSGTGITVVFGDKVLGIPLYLFYSSSSNSTKIVSVSIGDNVKSIGGYAFYECTSLTSVTIGNSVTSIGSSAFSGCTSLTSVIVGQSVKSIGDNAFSECTSLTSMPLPDRVTSIGSSAFSGCTSLTSVTIGNSVTSIGSSAFYGCTNLTRIDFNAINCGDLFYYSDVFYNAGSSGTGITVVFGDEVIGIPSYLFYSYLGNSAKVVSVSIGDNVKSIGSYAFLGCKSITIMTITDSVTSIGISAFAFGTSTKHVICYVYGCTENKLDLYANEHTELIYYKFFTITFKSQDGNNTLGTDTVMYHSDAAYSGTTPTKESTDQYAYTFVGWNFEMNQESATEYILNNVTSDRTVYAAFSKTSIGTPRDDPDFSIFIGVAVAAIVVLALIVTYTFRYRK